MYGLKTDWQEQAPLRYFTLSDYEGADARWCDGCGDHAILTACDDAARDRQLGDSQDYLARVLGAPPMIIAYPNGNFSDAVIEASRAAGLEMTVERAEADLAFWSSFGRLKLDVERASASGVDIHLGPFAAQDDEEAAEPFDFRGLAPLASVPRRLIVRSAEAEGTITDAAVPPLRGTAP